MILGDGMTFLKKLILKIKNTVKRSYSFLINIDKYEANQRYNDYEIYNESRLEHR